MRCAICDKEDPNIHYDYFRKEFTTCRDCSDVVTDTLLEFDLDSEDTGEEIYNVEVPLSEADHEQWRKLSGH